MRLRSPFAFVIVAVLALGALQLIGQSASKKLHVYLAVNKTDKPTTRFSADAPMICAFWKGEGLETGDKLILAGQPAMLATFLGGAGSAIPSVLWAGWLRRQGRVARRTLRRIADLAEAQSSLKRL